jgi:Holliday junction resolvasome RuvABC endonuclease subunit
MSTSVRILGVDPGLIITGYGLIDCLNGEPSLVEAGVIRIPTKLPNLSIATLISRGLV